MDNINTQTKDFQEKLVSLINSTPLPPANILLVLQITTIQMDMNFSCAIDVENKRFDSIDSSDSDNV